MCGIAGLLDRSDDVLPVLGRMLERLAHRGPDDSGSWLDGKSGMALGHRRLSIVDLSPAGHQPMVSATGSYVLNYNGEIYNHAALRAELEDIGLAPVWRGHSDTEVLLAACAAWGVEAALKRCNGMFAFALWDTRRQTLTLARDRMGEKPLYFGWAAGRFAFASELKAFDQLPGWSPRMHEQAITSFLTTGYVRGLESAIAGIFRLPAGCLLQLALEDMRSPHDSGWLSARIKTYWSLSETAAIGQAQVLQDPVDASAQLESLLRDAVALRMTADVPLGAFLSGGIDSSLVTALMQAQSTRPIRTFSIGFRERDYDEAPFARAIARHLGTDHTELYIDAAAALELVPKLAETFDEPFADHSQLPTLLISQLARQHVTVALSGDGGDELFAGYARYFAILKLLRMLGPLPMPLRRGTSSICRGASALLSPFSRGKRADASLSFRLARLSERLAKLDVEALRVAFIGGAGSSQILCDVTENALGQVPEPQRHNTLRKLMFGDQIDYLPNDILLKVDRSAMAYSLETRVPLLDHRVVEFSWRLAAPLLADRRQGKLLLRRVLERYVPRSLFDRPKQGFAPPMDTWLRGPLREWADSSLAAGSLRELPMLDVKAVRSLWDAHCSGRMNASYALWNVLMLADWRTRFRVSV